MFLLSAILNQKSITIKYGGTRLSLDLWILLLSGSGGGRGTALQTLNTITDTREIITGFAWGSGMGFKQKLAENPYGADLWGEFSEKMQAFNNGKMGDTKTWLTDCHDNFRIPKPITYRKTNKSADTPPIEFSGAPRTNILATSSETWLLENVASGDVGGGWLPRFVILRPDAKRKDVSIPAVLDPAKKLHLTNLLARAERVSVGSEARIDGIEQLIADWYVSAKNRFVAYDPHLGLAFFNRHRTNIIKAAVVFEASTSGTLNVSEASWERAVRLMDEVEKTVAHLMKIGVSPRGNLLQQIEDAILAAGKEGISQNGITRKFQRVAGKDLLDVLGTLVTGERVDTGGRKKTLLTHESFITGGQNGC